MMEMQVFDKKKNSEFTKKKKVLGFLTSAEKELRHEQGDGNAFAN